jgi:prophage DNA circulation protein
LLKLDFEPKLSATIKRSFRQTINQTIKTLLLPMADEQADAILQQYNQARSYLEQTLEKEAEETIKSNRRLQDEVEQKIEVYQQAVAGINTCLQGMLLNRHQLPIIGEADLMAIPVSVESGDFDVSPSFGRFADDLVDDIEANS